MDKSQRICVVGAGVAGLCTCKHLLDRGFDPVVLEATSDIGGIWRTAAISSTKLQTPYPAYQYSNFPWPQGTPLYPSAVQALDYLDAYAKHFQLLEKIQFNTKVLSIKKKNSDLDGNLGVWGEDKRYWEVTIRRHANDVEKLEFDFVVLCNGRFGDVPNIPTFPEGEGPEIFEGKSIHSLEYSKLDMKTMAGKRVVVVGFSKSAIDIAVEVANVNQGPRGFPCTMVFRTAHWIATEWKMFGLNFGYLYGNRFSEMLVPKPGQDILSATFSRMLFPLRWAIYKLCEVYLRFTYSLSKHGLVPQIGFWESLTACNIAMAPEGFFPSVDQGRIKLCKSPDWHYSKKGLILEGGKEVEADVVILATGFRGEVKLHSILPKEYVDVLQASGGPMSLYRGVVHPRIPNLAFIGQQEDISNLSVSEMGARWVSYLLDDKFRLPDAKTMERNADSWVKFMKATPYDKRPCLSTVKTWHNDDLCRDMGWNPKRKQGWFQELFSPYGNLDYE